MERIFANILESRFAGKSESTLIREIRDIATNIVTLRRDNATTVDEYITNVQSWKNPLIKVVKDIKDQLGFHYQQHPLYNSIVSSCDNLLQGVVSFEEELIIIRERFKNEKIKITTIGAARGGKSLFTQLLTGLDETVIRTQEGCEDCTGAISNLYHDPELGQGTFRANVIFHTEIEILIRINTILSEVWNANSWSPVRSNLPPQFTSINEIKNYLDKINEIKDDIKTADLELSVKNGLVAYFLDGEYLAYLGNDEIKITNDHQELERYCYIGAETPLYLAVKEIQLYTNMGMDNICENFIIADTQGASIIAGPKANEDIFRAIDDSDAIFSICPNQGTLAALEFYEKVLKSYINEDNNILRSSLPERHFALVNLWDGLPANNLVLTADQLEYTNTTNCVYLGYLRNVTSPKLPHVFVRKVVIDMLGRISKQVLNFDQNRIANCNSLREQLEKNINELDTLLKQFYPVLQLNFSKEDYVKNRLDKFFNSIMCHLIDMYRNYVRKEGDIRTDSRDDFSDEIDADEKELYLYKTITGCATVKITPVADVIDIAINKLYETVERKMIRHSDDHNIAYYLGDFITTFRKDFTTNMFVTFEQKKLDIKNDQERLISKIWDVFRIPIGLRNDSNKFIQDIVSFAAKDYYGNIPIPPTIFMCLNVLKGYFEDVNEDDWNNSDDVDSVLDKATLKAVLKSNIEKMDLDEAAANHYVNINVAKLEMYKDLWNFFAAHIDDNYLVDFYISYINLLTSDDPEYKKLLDKHNSDKILSLLIDEIYLGYKQTIKPLILVTNMIIENN